MKDTPATFRFSCLIVLLWLSLCGERSAGGADEVTTHRGITYLQRGERSLQADLYLPAGPGPHPAVLMVHGGGWRAGNRWQVYRHARVIAEAGFVVMAIDYRLAPEFPFPAALEDCREALRWIRKHASEYRVDPERVAGYGYSAGGHLVALMGCSDGWAGLEPAPAGEEMLSTRLQAVVAGGAPCDFAWLNESSRALAYVFGGSRAMVPDTYRQASPVTYVSADDPPVFLFHGAQDVLVPPVSARTFYQLLQQAGVRSELYVLPEAGHIATYLDAEMPRKTARFLVDVLKPDPLARSSSPVAPAEGQSLRSGSAGTPALP